MTRFFEDKQPDQDSLKTELYRTNLFSSNHPILTQIIRRNDILTDLYVLGNETQTDRGQRPVYADTVYEHAPPVQNEPETYFKPFKPQRFKQIKEPYFEDIVSNHGFGAKGQRTYHVVLTDHIKEYYENDKTLKPAEEFR